MYDTALIPLHDPTTPAVSLVTALAETGDLSADEYRQIYDRVAAGRSLRNIELALHSAVTYGWWAAYANGAKGLDRDRKNELRRWARANGGPDLPDLPPTPVEAVAAHVHPDAAVYRIGAADRQPGDPRWQRRPSRQPAHQRRLHPHRLAPLPARGGSR